MCMACGSGVPPKTEGDQDNTPDNTIIQSKESPRSLEVVFGSSLHEMNTALRLCCDFLKRKNIAEETKNHIVLRELLTNAISHGNQMVAERKVTVYLEWIPPDDVTIRVEDEGSGFDHHSLNLDLPANPARMRHRGFILINALCEGIEFNNKGNCVVVRICSAKNKAEK